MCFSRFALVRFRIDLPGFSPSLRGRWSLHLASRSFRRSAFESRTFDLDFSSQRRITVGSISATALNEACAARNLPTAFNPGSSNAWPFQNKRLTVFADAL